MIGGKIPGQDAIMKDIYKKFKDEDGALYITYQNQEVFWSIYTNIFLHFLFFLLIEPLFIQ